MGSFMPKRPDWADEIKKKYLEAEKGIDEKLLKRMISAVGIVFRTATAKRPKISLAQHKAMGRKTKISGKSAYRVSDPEAALGVPVATGDLQASIKKDITKKGEKFTGRIYIDGPGERYANAIEYGTSRMKARPFMRPALHLNTDKIKRIFRGENG